MKLSLYGGLLCGGKNIQIHLIQGARECKTKVIDGIRKGEGYYFGLGTCGKTSFIAEKPAINFKIITTDTNAFCPMDVRIRIGGGIFETKFDHYWHSQENNNKLYTANRIN